MNNFIFYNNRKLQLQNENITQPKTEKFWTIIFISVCLIICKFATKIEHLEFVDNKKLSKYCIEHIKINFSHIKMTWRIRQIQLYNVYMYIYTHKYIDSKSAIIYAAWLFGKILLYVSKNSICPGFFENNVLSFLTYS